MSLSTPTKVSVPFAQSGLKEAIPASSDNINGRAGYDQGFPPINMTPRTAGGIPPFGQDMNGILYDVTLALQYLEAGGQFPYDAAFATAIGGYPNGAVVSRSDLQGVWRNTVNGNTSNPETGGAGWQPEGAGATTVAMSSSNVTLTALQAARSIIIITGTLTANLQLIFPAYIKQWLVVNSATGAFTVTCKTASGSGVSIDAGKSAHVYGNGTNISGSLNLGNAAYATIMSTNVDTTAGRLMSVGAYGAGISVPVTTGTILDSRPNGIYHIDSTTVSGSPSGGNGILRTASAPGDPNFAVYTFYGWNGIKYENTKGSGVWGGWKPVFDGGNVSAFIQTLFDDPDAATAQTTLNGFGYGQTWQDVTASRAANTTYTNTAGRPIMVNVFRTGGDANSLYVDGLLVGAINGESNVGSNISGIVPPGSTYSTNFAPQFWMELR